MIITDTTLQGIKTELQRRNTILTEIAGLFPAGQWESIQANVRAGLAPTLYPVGTELTTPYSNNGFTGEFVWVVLDNNRTATMEDGTTRPGLWLGAKYGTHETLQYDAAEGTPATEETAQSGVYYCGVTGSGPTGTYTLLELSAGDAIPYSSYTSVLKSPIQNAGIFKDGYNRYRDCAMRQWLNSAEAAGDWWTATHAGDNAPAEASTIDGFMAGFDEDFLAVIQPAKVQAIADSSTSGGAGGAVDVLYDRFWLQSLEEVYGAPQTAGPEGPYFPYWKNVTGMNSPSNGTISSTNDARKIPKLGTTTAALIRIRTVSKWTCYNQWQVNKEGYISNNTARNSSSLLVGCVIC